MKTNARPQRRLPRIGTLTLSPKASDIVGSFRSYGMAVALLIMTVGVSLLNPQFLTPENMTTILKQSSIIGIMAVGQTFVFIGKGFDLSVGAVLGASAMATLVIFNTGLGWWAIIPGLGVGLLAGLISGLLVTKARINPFVTTLGMKIVVAGALIGVRGGQPELAHGQDFLFLGAGYIGPVALPIVIFALVVIVGYFLLSSTIYGRYVYAVGGNETSAKLSGINVGLVRASTYVVSGMLAALSGIILASRLGGVRTNTGDGSELDVIAAVVIGGTSLNGGEGGVGRTLIGVLILGVLSNALIQLNVDPYYQQMTKGLLILGAVALDSLGRRESK